MAKRDMKKALGASLKAEEQAVRSRFEKAGTVLREKEPVPWEQSKPDGAGKVISDSLTIPEGKYELVSRIKRRCLKAGISAKKSEVLRAGLVALDAMEDRELERLFESLPRGKTGRPVRKFLFFIVHYANAVKFRQPLQIKHFHSVRRVIIGHKLVTITVERSITYELVPAKGA